MKKIILFTLILGLWASQAQADVHINIYHDATGTITGAMPDEESDVFWNDALGTSYFNWSTTSAIRDHNGDDTTVGFTLVKPNTPAIAFDASGGENYDGTPHYAAARANLAAGREVHMTLDNLNANFPDGYIVFAHVGGQSENTGASVSLTQGTAADWDAGLSTDSYYFKTRWNPAGFTTPVQATDLTSSVGANTTVADYALFDAGYNADQITITVDAIEGGWAGLGGVEVIAIPEPATIGFMSISTVGLLFMRKRFGILS